MGVGTGNWKVVVLKYENLDLKDFTYMYKSHNDFLEITAENGLPGGLAYTAIIGLILFCFFKTSLKSIKDDSRLKFLFLPAFGILAYSVDAFFNFPADRPEIQSLFAMYVAGGIAFSGPGFTFNNQSFIKLPGLPRINLPQSQLSVSMVNPLQLLKHDTSIGKVALMK